jgi:hypothetical protein
MKYEVRIGANLKEACSHESSFVQLRELDNFGTRSIFPTFVGLDYQTSAKENIFYVMSLR